MKSVYILLVLLIGMMVFGNCLVATAAEPEVYGKMENFTWKEFKDDGSQLLKESGSIYTVGIKYTNQIGKEQNLTVKLEQFSGGINYDGATQSGTPVKSKTNYSGFKVEGDIGNRVPYMSSDTVATDAFLGLGYRQWTRDIESAGGGIGYKEKWKTLYTKVGVRQKTAKSTGEIGLKIPLENENKVDDFGVTLNPGKQPALFAEYSIAAGSGTVSLSYERMNFTKSSSTASSMLPEPDNLVYQPKSTADIWGICINIPFN